MALIQVQKNRAKEPDYQESGLAETGDGVCCLPFLFFSGSKTYMNLPEYLQTIPQTVRLALAEDIGSGDVTASLIGEDSFSEARIISREKAVLCGVADQVEADAVLCTVRGPARGMLTAERVALNFVQLLSATATATHDYVELIKHTHCKILDTRKTLPGLRAAQKYAVLCGGGANHRIGLYDRVLIKENHIMAVGSIAAAVEKARRLHPGIKVEVETETLDEFQQASAAGADIIMLDEFELDVMREVVKLNNGRIPLEASGGVNQQTVADIAETGVDYISVGEITKHIRAVDLSMRFVNQAFG